MNVFVVGGGGREHTIIWKLSKSKNVDEIFACPGNVGIEEIATCEKIEDKNLEGLLSFAKEKKSSLTIVGPEIPLSLGIVDLFKKNKLKIFGPTQKASLLESSKCFSKEFMKRHNIPTADFTITDNLQDSIRIIEKKKGPFVIKFDGLAAGKGVRVIESFNEGKNYLEEIFIKKIFKGTPKVVIEDCLIGKELSYLIFTDTNSYISMVPAKDYKRVFDKDKGPNTGGMGCYSPPVYFNEEIEKQIKGKIVEKTLNGLQKENIDYKGVLYFGLMITENGPFVLEYNVRFGDPETQVILPRLESDLVEIIEAVIEGQLKKVKVKWADEKAVCIILASKGYPEKYEIGKEINGLDKVKDVLVFHAGTKREDSKIVTSGGRVLGIVGIDKAIEKAREKVYKAAEIIDFEGKHYRKDIGIE